MFHVAHLTEDHVAINRAWREACDRGECTPAECDSNCYDLAPPLPQAVAA